MKSKETKSNSLLHHRLPPSPATPRIVHLPSSTTINLRSHPFSTTPQPS
ncbi:hypothetical protein L195_g063853, partial [Trifolium pratense]